MEVVITTLSPCEETSEMGRRPKQPVRNRKQKQAAVMQQIKPKTMSMASTSHVCPVASGPARTSKSLQLLHVALLGRETSPNPQFSQLLLFGPAKVPPLHGSHVRASLAKRPASHRLQVPLPATEMVPCWHRLQNCLSTSWVPAGHASHAMLPGSLEISPIGHSEQFLLPASENCPAGQLRHSLLPAEEKVPAAHCQHSVLPGTFEIVPAGHSEQLLLPGSE